MIKSANEIPVAYEKEIVTTSTDDEMATSCDNSSESHETKTNESRPTFEPSEFYNGACFENYCWSQSVNEIGITNNCGKRLTMRLVTCSPFRIEHLTA